MKALLSKVVGGPDSLVLEDVPRASLERLTAILLPGHDHGWLAFYLYSTSPLYPDGKAVGSNFRVSPRDLPVSAMGEPLDSVMEFSEPVLEAFAEWRCEPLPGRASGWPAPGARPTGHTPPPC